MEGAFSVCAEDERSPSSCVMAMCNCQILPSICIFKGERVYSWWFQSFYLYLPDKGLYSCGPLQSIHTDNPVCGMYNSMYQNKKLINGFNFRLDVRLFFLLFSSPPRQGCIVGPSLLNDISQLAN